jgi:hypothetical protein
MPPGPISSTRLGSPVASSIVYRRTPRRVGALRITVPRSPPGLATIRPMSVGRGVMPSVSTRFSGSIGRPSASILSGVIVACRPTVATLRSESIMSNHQ